ncbi:MULTISPECIES: MurR/RpiR family transcriptional regulator [unclassified Nocardioides]|uniref:MurR/RpiR family transcriptional regulator n=1 Tax=unclassified Nocardioides TaxID=2615069 RepID=UPI0009F0379E|nr:MULTISPECIES: MurR/RpiR family transcriptional regulator [unclassified Nocardioides]GAW49162.1 Transcriptional regulator [Nocardioides sp. PD653-B2]GAW55650.1 Transcriptional regulator [Nocardioides sp. PD653]
MADELLAQEGNLEDRVRHAQLTPAQRQIARMLLDQPDRFMFLSAAEMAAQADVSQPSVSRLAKALGYDSYASMLDDVRERGRLAREDEGGVARNRHQREIDDEIELLKNLRRRLADGRSLQDAAQVISSAEQVVVLGLRISSPLAQTFAYRLGRMRSNVHLITTDGSQTYDDLAMGARARSPAMVVFAMPRYPQSIVTIIDFARRQGYQVVLITDTDASPLVAAADVVLIAEINWGLTFGTHTSANVLLAMLAEEVAHLRQEDVRQRLDRLDGVASEIGHYLSH